MDDLVKVPGGRFLMGRGLTDTEILQLPRSRKIRGGVEPYLARAATLPPPPMNEVSVRSFWIGRYPVTQGEWVELFPTNPSRFLDPLRPVECITFEDAVEYCNRRSQREGLTPCYRSAGGQIDCDFTASGYRLPTEAEWEYAARGGQVGRGYIFPGSDDVNAVAWHATNAGNQTHPVGRKEPNELGLYDLAGQVWERCWDWYLADYIPEGENPVGPTSPTQTLKRVVKGGCYKNSPHLLYTGRRIGRTMGTANDHLGFRIVRTAF